jgi:hypothetical protein
MRFENAGKFSYSSLGRRLLKAYELFRAPGSETVPQYFDESSLLPSLIRTTLCGSYDDVATNFGDEQIWLQPHNMYEDFIAWMVFVALEDVKEGQWNSLHALQDRFQIVDEAIACAWLSQAGNSVAECASSGVSSCLTVAEIKQVYRRKMSPISPKLQEWIDRSENILWALDWPHDDIRVAVKIIEALVFMGGDPYRFASATNAGFLERMIFTTEQGSFGLGPPAIKPDDIVIILFGGRVPFILRPTDVDGEYHFIRDCYIDGIM